MFWDTDDNRDQNSDVDPMDPLELEDYKNQIVTFWKTVYCNITPLHRRKMTEEILNDIRRTYRRWYLFLFILY